MSRFFVLSVESKICQGHTLSVWVSKFKMDPEIRNYEIMYGNLKEALKDKLNKDVSRNIFC